jgi:hypothetical protein
MSDSQMVFNQKIRNHQDKIFSVLDNTAITPLFGQQFEQPFVCLMCWTNVCWTNGSQPKEREVPPNHLFLYYTMYVGQMPVGQTVFNQKT